jgi:hypothetical protein
MKTNGKRLGSIRVLPIFCCIIFSQSCNNSEVPAIDATYIIDIDRAEKKDKFHLSDIVKSVKPILLEETDSSLIGYIDELQVFDNNIFVLDMYIAKKLFVYDMSGKYLKQIGVLGQAPNEYRGISDFCIDHSKKEIYLLDYWKNRLLKHRITDGKYLHTINLPRNMSYSGMIYHDNNIYIGFVHDDSAETDNMLMKIDLKTEEIEEYISAKTYSLGWSAHPRCIFDKNERLTCIKRYMNTIFSIDNNGVHPYIFVKSKDWIQKKDILSEEELETKDEEAIFTERHRAYEIMNYIENDTVVHFDYRKEQRRHITYNKQTGVTYNYKHIVNDFEDILQKHNGYYFKHITGKFAYKPTSSSSISYYLEHGMLDPELASKLKALNLNEEGYLILEYELK